ncbi:hypothetical protein [Pseudomonas veronii]|uniref:Uncharacterized protein n=1 Tax=Pseudomonas veronii TaxID=76761 RepID=A0A4P7Y0L8_PSEVE|nr:hypothetical protein [Pseudomonas veronii]QCG64297.1 hypothetical protein E4167_00285 [Pseudomonas veronii]
MSDFKTEDRYIVIKRSDLKKVPIAYRSALVDPMLSLLSHLPRRQYVVIESGWPEYHLVWAMLKHRLAGKPVPDFDLWRHADELQQRLTAADERADLLERDAARYRWLRDPENRDGLEPEDLLIVGIAEGEDIVWLEQMDKAIDANLESLKPTEGGGDGL